MKKRKEYYEYPKRICRTMHYCNVCERPILLGEEYFDGGYGRRCHVVCHLPLDEAEAILKKIAIPKIEN